MSSFTTGEEIFKVLNEYINNNLDWNKCISVCTDGGASMTGKNKGLISRIKAEHPFIKSFHCIIHRQALATKRMSEELNEALNIVIKTVNYIKSKHLNSRLFSNLCLEMGSEYQNLLLHTEVRWLSRGRVLMRVFEMKSEIIEFLSEQNLDLHNFYVNEMFVSKIAYLADIFNHINSLNLNLQNNSIIGLNSNISGFMKKLKVWVQRVRNDSIEMFPLLKNHIESTKIYFSPIKAIIDKHLTELLKNFEEYFPEIKDRYKFEWIWNPFKVESETQDLCEELKDQLIQLSCDSLLESSFKNRELINFWISIANEYQELSGKAVEYLMPFSSTYLCEKSFSALTYIKNKYRNTLSNVELDLRIALSNISPRIKELCIKKQAHPSH